MNLFQSTSCQNLALLELDDLGQVSKGIYKLNYVQAETRDEVPFEVVHAVGWYPPVL